MTSRLILDLYAYTRLSCIVTKRVETLGREQISMKSLGLAQFRKRIRGVCILLNLKKGGRYADLAYSTFLGDGIGTIHHLDFMEDEKFLSAFSNAVDNLPNGLRQNVSHDLGWRAHIVGWAAQHVLALPEKGDFVECGVFYGVLSKHIFNFVDFEQVDRKFFLFDTWGSEGSHPSYTEDIYEKVKLRFNYVNAILVRGKIPEVLRSVKFNKIAYLSIDMNSCLPERAVLEFFYDKMISGGIFYFDDYGWQGFPELRVTVNDFFADKPETLLQFPTGQSIAIKVGSRLH
jgi:O-methyltransferase